MCCCCFSTRGRPEHSPGRFWQCHLYVLVQTGPLLTVYQSSILDIDLYPFWYLPLYPLSQWLESYSSPHAQVWGRGAEVAQGRCILPLYISCRELGSETKYLASLICTVCSNLEDGRGSPFTTWPRRLETQSACTA